MKKKMVTMLAVLMVSAGTVAGCAREPQQDTGSGVQQGEVSQESSAEAEAETGEPGSAQEDVSEVTGTLDEIKDFMFVVTDDDGISYAFTFEEKPEGLEQAASGDRVTVKYTGTISEVDPFEGEVLSVEKQ